MTDPTTVPPAPNPQAHAATQPTTHDCIRTEALQYAVDGPCCANFPVEHLIDRLERTK